MNASHLVTAAFAIAGAASIVLLLHVLGLPRWLREFWGERKRQRDALERLKGHDYACSLLRDSKLHAVVIDQLHRMIAVSQAAGAYGPFEQGIADALAKTHVAMALRRQDKVKEFQTHMALVAQAQQERHRQRW